MANTSTLTKLVILSVIIIVPIAIVIGVRNSPSPTPSTTTHSEVATKPQTSTTGSQFEREIQRASFQGDWPLLRERATLKCWPAGGGRSPAIAVIVDGHDYALTGFSAAYLKKPMLPPAEWLDNDSTPGAKVSIGDLIAAGSALCQNI